MSNNQSIMITIAKVIIVITQALCIAFKSLSMSFIALLFKAFAAKIAKISIYQIKMSKTADFLSAVFPLSYYVYLTQPASCGSVIYVVDAKR